MIFSQENLKLCGYSEPRFTTDSTYTSSPMLVYKYTKTIGTCEITITEYQIGPNQYNYIPEATSIVKEIDDLGISSRVFSKSLHIEDVENIMVEISDFIYNISVKPKQENRAVNHDLNIDAVLSCESV
jgi:hypothetical protein